MFQAEIPIPPSANNMFRNVPGRGRVRTKDYTAWRTAAHWQIKEPAAAVQFDDPVEVSITVPRQPRSDIDNRIKPVLDLLVKSGVIKDDDAKHVRKVSAEWGDVFAPCVVTVRECA